MKVGNKMENDNSLRDLKIKLNYRSSEDNLTEDFYIPVLSSAVEYKRAVGFFSSSALAEISKGIKGITDNEGKISVIASPKLSKEDIEAINKGYKERVDVIEKSLLKHLEEPESYFEKERLNIVAHLIKMGVLNIKIAVLEQRDQLGLYHEKFAIVKDEYNNKIAFTGSLNESTTAFKYNFESIDVYCSWKSSESAERVKVKEKEFDELWRNKTNKLKIFDFPDAVKNKVLTYKKESIDWEIDHSQYNTVNNNIETVSEKTKSFNDYYPKIPDEIELYDYQEKAVNNWLDKNGQGIYDMATGTGKTYTALASAAQLYNKLDKLAVVIVCPYSHLVDQWVNDIEEFNMDPIVGHSQSSQNNWEEKLKEAILDYNLGVKNNICFVTTNGTFALERIKKQLEKIEENVLLIGDEAHNLGANKVSEALNPNFKYRLALSATIVRHRDEEGTKKLLDYFGERCMNYSLQEAIDDGYLAQYRYYPVVVSLNSGELSEYRKLTKKLSKYISKDSKGKTHLSDQGKFIAIKRARLVAGARNKLDALKDVIKKYKNSHHMLIYCGATTVGDIDYEFKDINETEIKQISAVNNLLGNELNMRVAKFTSEENTEQRRKIRKNFEEGNLQAIVAIRCLDEGIDIPKIKRAFILASSTNPKEYVQRRGRVLRLAENKKYAEIYDFITLPRPLDKARNMPREILDKDKSLIRKELKRLRDFAELSLNYHESSKLINDLENIYNIRGE